MNENEVAREIVDAAYQIHRKLSPVWTQMNADCQDFQYKELTEKIIKIFVSI